MGLSNFPSAADGVIPVLVMNSVVWVALLKNVVRWVLQVFRATSWDSRKMEAESETERRYKYVRWRSGWERVECCVCLCGFEGSEEVTQLSCNHFFHKACLDKWFHYKHTTCPLCRSIY